MVAAAAAKWKHSPYICRSDQHTIYVTKGGEVFSRHVQVLQLNSPREKLPCFVEMKPEKRDYFHQLFRSPGFPQEIGEDLPFDLDEYKWFLSRWILNHFAVWNGKRNSDDVKSLQQEPLSSYSDTFGTTYKSADLAVDAIAGRFLTREIIIGLRDYVQWKETGTPVFDRFDIPVDIPTADLEVHVIVDQELFGAMGVEGGEVASLALEFRNRESAKLEGKEVALYPEIRIEEQYGRTLDDDGAGEAIAKLDQMRQRIHHILEGATAEGTEGSDLAARKALSGVLSMPRDFLFYRLRWPSPLLGLEACVRWEKPVRKQKRLIQADTSALALGRAELKRKQVTER
jgi:hypothetical protein